MLNLRDFASLCRQYDCDFTVEFSNGTQFVIQRKTIIGDEARFERIWEEAGLEWREWPTKFVFDCESL